MYFPDVPIIIYVVSVAVTTGIAKITATLSFIIYSDLIFRITRKIFGRPRIIIYFHVIERKMV